jgi:hypothetical protein
MGQNTEVPISHELGPDSLLAILPDSIPELSQEPIKLDPVARSVGQNSTALIAIQKSIFPSTAFDIA